jgi:integrase/recombinase XerD
VDPWLGMSDDLVRRFVDVLLVEHRYSVYTCAGYRTDVRNLDRWLQRFESCTLVTATDAQLIRYLSDWTRRHASLRKLSRVLLSLRRFYSFLFDSHVRGDDPMRSPAIERWNEQRRPRSVTVLRQRESSRAVAERDRVMLALMIAGGLQAAQLIALRLSDLHLEEGHLSVRGESTETVSLSPTLIGMMRQFLLAPRETLLAGRDSAHVFPSCGGRMLTRREFWCAFRRRADSFRALTGRGGSASRSSRWSFGPGASELSRHEGC